MAKKEKETLQGAELEREGKVENKPPKEQREEVAKMNLYQRLDLVRVEIGIVNKNLSVMNQYKAVGETDVLKAVNEAEHKARLVSYQESLEILNYGQTQTANYLRVRVKVRVVNIDNPQESVVFEGIGDGYDKGDKAPGKAVTYAMKYALMRGYKIPTGEDPDYFASPNKLAEELASEEEVAHYTELIGGEKNVAYVCKKLGVSSFAELTKSRIQARIKAREEAIAEEQRKRTEKELENGEEGENA